MIKITKIKPNKDNPRLVKDDKFYKLVESIKSFGDKMMPLRPIVVDENWIVLGGNMRLKALKELGYKEIDESWIKQSKDLTEEDKREFIIKDNVGFGIWDWEILQDDWDLSKLEDWGMDIPEFEIELDPIEDECEDIDIIDVDILEGDIIQFYSGDIVHRLICGDSTCSDTLNKLMDKKKAQCVLTDPPYEIDLDYTNISLFTENAHIFIFNNDRALVRQLSKSPFNFKKFFVFNHRGCAIPQEGGHECFLDHILVSHEINGKPKTRFNIGDGLRTVIQGEYRRSKHHKHEKPFNLLADLLKGYTSTNDIVLDMFSGGGSLFSACNQLKRVCYGIELDPENCQRIVNRMIDLDSNIKVFVNNKEYCKKKLDKVCI